MRSGKLYCDRCYVLKIHHKNIDCKYPDYHCYPNHLQKDDNPRWQQIMKATFGENSRE